MNLKFLGEKRHRETRRKRVEDTEDTGKRVRGKRLFHSFLTRDLEVEEAQNDGTGIGHMMVIIFV